jgi:hypothetical protein
MYKPINQDAVILLRSSKRQAAENFCDGCNMTRTPSPHSRLLAIVSVNRHFSVAQRRQGMQSAWWYRFGAAGALCALLAGFSVYPPLAADQGASGGSAVRADSISIDGAVEHPRTLTLADLKREQATTETVSLKTGRGVLTGSYTGVLLWTLLQQATIKISPNSKNDVIRRTIVVTSSDGYTAVLSAAEIDPEFGDDRALIAYAKDGQPLTDSRGFARLILPSDKEAARAISGVAGITVR